MVNCLMCGAELPIGGLRGAPGVFDKEATCEYCHGAWRVRFVCVGSRDDRTEVRPGDDATKERYAAYKRGLAKESAAKAERLINLGRA